MKETSSNENLDSKKQPLSLQDQYAPRSICFGCGPSNLKGLQIKSFAVEGAQSGTPDRPGLTQMEFQPEPHHQAFPAMVNGGIIGTLLDCHSNWTAAYALKKQMESSSAHQDLPVELPCTVTADFHVKLRAPTPSNQKIWVQAWPLELKSDRALIRAELFTVGVGGEKKLTATCEGTFVAVKPGHPAYHRWG